MLQYCPINCLNESIAPAHLNYELLKQIQRHSRTQKMSRFVAVTLHDLPGL